MSEKNFFTPTMSYVCAVDHYQARPIWDLLDLTDASGCGSVMEIICGD